jgi:hypothetical protein
VWRRDGMRDERDGMNGSGDTALDTETQIPQETQMRGMAFI